MAHTPIIGGGQGRRDYTATDLRRDPDGRFVVVVSVTAWCIVALATAAGVTVALCLAAEWAVTRW